MSTCPICCQHHQSACDDVLHLSNSFQQAPKPRHDNLDPKFDIKCSQATFALLADLRDEFDDELGTDEVQQLLIDIDGRTRLKAVNSLVNKCRLTRWQEKPLQTVEDLIGIRCIVPSLAHVCTKGAHIATQANIVWCNDLITRPTRIGYRALHFVARASSGRLLEIQVQTRNQAKFASFIHDRVYKNSHLNVPGKIVQAYFSKISEELYRRDKDENPSPVAIPQEITDANLQFPL